MSLINDLLNDLENRQGNSRENGELFQDVAPVREPMEESGGHGYRPWVYGLLLVASLALVLHFHDFGPTDELTEIDTLERPLATEPARPALRTIAPEKQRLAQVPEPSPRQAEPQDAEAANPVAGLTPIKPLAAADKTKAAAAPDRQTDTIVVNRVSLKPIAEGVRADISMSDRADYKVYTLSQPHRLVLEIRDAKTSGKDFDVAENPYVKKVREGKHDNDLKLVFDLKEPVDYADNGLLVDDEDAVLSLVLHSVVSQPAARDVSRKIEPAAPAGKTDEVETASERKMQLQPSKRSSTTANEMRYKRAKQAYGNGELESAVELLTEVLGAEPDYDKARYLLVSTYLKSGRVDLAIDQLEQGLEATPANIRLRRLYAQLLYDAGKSQAALKVVSALSPSVKNEPEYNALKAALLQQEERHAEAAALYRKLVNVAADRSVWWVGLAISLEGLDRPDEAVAAYRNALSGKGLSGSLRQYVTQQIQSLTTEQRT